MTKNKVERKFAVLVPMLLNKTGRTALPAHITKGAPDTVLESELSTDEAGMRWHIRHKHMRQIAGEPLDLTAVDEQPIKTG